MFNTEPVLTLSRVYTGTAPMNLTITVEDDVLKRARIRALEENTSVNAVLRRYLQSYAGAARRRHSALEDLLRLSGTASSGRAGAGWTREDLHDR